MKSARSSSRRLTLTGSPNSLTSWSRRGSVLPGTISPPFGRCTDGRVRSTTGRRGESRSARGVAFCHRSSSAPSATIPTRCRASSLCRLLTVDLTTSAGSSKRPKPLMADLTPNPGAAAVDDFRQKLPPEAFAIGPETEPEPSDLMDEEAWTELTYLPDDVSLRTSDHHGTLL